MITTGARQLRLSSIPPSRSAVNFSSRGLVRPPSFLHAQNLLNALVEACRYLGENSMPSFGSLTSASCTHLRANFRFRKSVLCQSTKRQPPAKRYKRLRQVRHYGQTVSSLTGFTVVLPMNRRCCHRNLIDMYSRFGGPSIPPEKLLDIARPSSDPASADRSMKPL